MIGGGFVQDIAIFAGDRVSSLAAAMVECAEFSERTDFDRFRENIDPAWIEEALARSGAASVRRRRLPAEQVVWLVIGMALLRNLPIRDVVSRLDLVLPDPQRGKLAHSSIPQARQRLGGEPIKWLFERCAQVWALASAQAHSWKGLSLFAMDGSTLRVPDSDENRAHFGLASGGHRGDSGYPIARFVALMAVRSHLLLAANFGPYSEGEHTLAKPLWDKIPDHSLTIVDKGFFGAQVLMGIQAGGVNRHWLVRAKRKTKWRTIQSFGKHDKLVELTVSKMARAKDPSLPATIVCRAIEYQHPDSKGPQWLLTSLVDAGHTRSDIVALYHERWEIEIGYDEMKTHLLEREESIRSRTKAGVDQEIWGIMLAYNLVRFEMERAADQAGIEPRRISFVGALRAIRDELFWCPLDSPGAIPQRLRNMRQRILEQLLPPRRSERRYPRAVKIKMSNYAKKRRPAKAVETNATPTETTN